MHVQVVNFNLDGMTEDEFHAFGHETAEQFAAVPGLVAKVWLKDSDANTYGAVYLWQDEDAYRGWTQTDLFEAVRTHPNFANLTSRDFGVFDDLTAKTQPGLRALAVAGG